MPCTIPIDGHECACGRQAGQAVSQAWLTSAASQIEQMLKTWLQRSRQRQALADLDGRMLKDIGLSRVQVRREVAKPFWQQ